VIRWSYREEDLEAISVSLGFPKTSFIKLMLSVPMSNVINTMSCCGSGHTGTSLSGKFLDYRSSLPPTNDDLN
jgi:hypothetical protein